MTATKHGNGPQPGAQENSVKAWLTRPLTITAPTYAVYAAGVAVLGLILVAID